MVIVVYTLWIVILLYLIINIFKFSNKNSPRYSLKKRNILLMALTIQILCSLAFIALFISEALDAAASI